MIFELRLYKKGCLGKKPNKVITFTWWSCKGNCIGHADGLALYSGHAGDGGFATMELLERHFYGPEKNRDYGWGQGYEPVMVGTV